MNYSWDTIRDQVRDFRTNLQAIYPLQILSTVKEFTIDASNQLYFLSDHLALTNEISPSRNLQLYHVDLNKIPYSDWLNKSDRMTEAEYLAACSKASLLEWNVLFEEYCNPKTGTHFRLQSITSYDIKDDTVMFTSHNGIFISKMEQIPRLVYSRSMHVGNTQSTERYPTSKTLLLDGRLDPKLGGNHADKIAFIKNRDIWVMDLEGNERQLTFCSLNTKDPTLNCGGVEYMMQEEFHRFTGYYWAPSDPDSPVDRIVYLETSELEVELLRISKPAISFSGSDTLLNHTECMRYPYAGKPNATSKIRIVEFSDTEIIHRKLLDHDELHIAFPWMEYIVRFGWIPNGQSVWAQILSRDQKRTAIVKLALEQFISSSSSLSAEILWEETNSAWINVTDAYYFMKQTDATVTRLIWSSEKSNGYRHLYLVEKHIDQPAIITQLTHGEWCCLDKPIYVDESRGLVYFSAKADTPLEPHFYVVSYIRPQDGIKRLTQPGFSHTVTMTCPDYFVDCFSNLHHPHIFSVQKIDHSSLLPSISSYKGLILPVCRITPYQNSSPCIANTLFLHTNSPAAENIKHYEEATLIYESVLSNGHLFSFTTSDGVVLYGCLYRPRSYQPGYSYPTILHIYGGPKSQMVVNEFRFPRLMRYLMSVYFGFAVVIIDGRGSSDRGLHFESHIQYRLGTVELKDQIEGLQFLYNTKFGAGVTMDGRKVSVVDLNRVAITGWSYGGYLSLMALGQYPDLFKIAIAGAPVTQWELYDAAYTERYMGLPSENRKAYAKSSVLPYVRDFPDSGNRLLIAHGLIDENVHFKNTEALVTELVKHNKHHYLQVYPNEKHGLRHASVNEHFETLMFYWLTNYL